MSNDAQLIESIVEATNCSVAIAKIGKQWTVSAGTHVRSSGSVTQALINLRNAIIAFEQNKALKLEARQSEVKQRLKTLGASNG